MQKWSRLDDERAGGVEVIALQRKSLDDAVSTLRILPLRDQRLASVRELLQKCRRFFRRWGWARSRRLISSRTWSIPGRRSGALLYWRRSERSLRCWPRSTRTAAAGRASVIGDRTVGAGDEGPFVDALRVGIDLFDLGFVDLDAQTRPLR